VFLFTGASGEQFGYHDGFQDDGVFWYTGEGQLGDMEMVRGNRAIRDHEADEKELHLFEATSKGLVRYLGEATYLGYHEATAPDRDGDLRRAFVFELALDEDQPDADVPDVRVPPELPSRALRGCTLDQLRTAALATASPSAPAAERRAVIRVRSEAVRLYVLKRANGQCEGCGAQAPFLNTRGEPYLEAHHIRRVADGGPDHPRWVAAICPTCHRRVHHGQDGQDWNEWIAMSVGTIEAG
jgi:5-methylcytosine-specific restriction protein A